MKVRPMRPGEEAAVAEMVKALARDTGLDVKPRLTGELLRDHNNLLSITVAEEDGRLLGACLTLMTFSTWRGAKGLYVVDLFVEGAARGQGVGEALLVAAARRGWERGAQFVKLEVDVTNLGAARFYDRLRFDRKPHDRLFVLETDEMERLLRGEVS